MIYKIAALFATLSFAASAASAAPLWEQSDRWTCDLDLYFKVKTDGSGFKNLNSEERTITFDFKEGTQSSVFVQNPGKIVDKHYADGAFGGYNVLAVDWGSGVIQVVIMEEEGSVWMPTVSSFSGGEPWFANYKCLPET